MSSSKEPAPSTVQSGSGSGNNIIISPLQRGNPVLECIRNVGKEFGEIVADYQVGRTTAVLFLSLKYHRLHPEYIHMRIEKLGNSYGLRIVLILCDVSEHKEPIREITKTCLINNMTAIVAFSFEDAGHYLSTFKQFEHKPPDIIKERVDKDYDSMLRTSLTSINRINKTDVETLKTSFGSFANIAKASSEQLQNLPGFGQVKMRNLKNAFDKPFRNQSTSTARANLRATQSQPIPAVDNQSRELSSKAKGKRPALREPSPEWEIELQDSLPDSIHKDTIETSGNSKWDIELDLNESD
ncbi:hypothetical protein ONZ45_g11125 [Pleurotus djamor]|nr:hypothetical protein ONZ45_g11125 [Pleurotus djamor]